MSIVKIYLLISSLILISAANSALYPGERLMNAANAQTLVYFSKGNPSKPLVIFIPGDSHLARISYGYQNGKKQDFLDYWLTKKGYSFLAVSYPLENSVYSKVYPNFSIQDWGEQIVDVAQKIIKENQLSNSIIILGWSMGGSIEQTVAAAAKERGLKLELFIGLAAVPPLPYVMQSGPYETKTMRANHLADRTALFPVFTQLLDEQDRYNQHTIIPQSIYLSQFVGHIPAAIAAEGYSYQNGQLIKNVQQTLKDGGVFNFANTPWIALIEDDSPTTAKISLIDPAAWDFIRTEMIYNHYLKGNDLNKLTPEQWSRLAHLIDETPDYLKLNVHGNHFFFVGEKGASATADKIEELESRVKKISGQIENITSDPFRTKITN
ncbi:Alpha/beta hydrolase family protein [Legionella nautarum]|uniref:Alpha/beta hydrolase family protein n=1 Tax=Legionella nautarum TaxID=45070 RepID=A0A0W0WWI5_9GAMM|nr:alpha/beta hydrolase [Legionella nautarum]KTD36641.1 Alpha/beta hydrolase family protein [Legionella nautarum]